jgi:hypothetical protein
MDPDALLLIFLLLVVIAVIMHPPGPGTPLREHVS